MTISVVIPAYNEEKYLPLTLKALQNQLHPNFDFEIIVADANSEDKTVEIAKEFGAKVIIVPKINPATARQRAVEISQGEIIACIDADTIVPQDHLKNLVWEFAKDPQAVGLSGLIEGSGGRPWLNFLYKVGNNFFSKLNYLLGRTGFQGQSFAFKKSAFQKIGGFNTQLHTGEDFDLGIRMSRVGKVKFINKTFGISSTRRAKEGLFKAMFRGFASYLAVVWKITFFKKEKEEFPSVR